MLGITVTVLFIVFGQLAIIKTSLKSNCAYSRYVSSLIEGNKKLPQNAENSILKDPAIIQILTNSFSSADLEQKTEVFIDSIYYWLRCDTKTLAFTIAFTANKRTFADGFASYAFVRFTSLPICKQKPPA